jgi:hypothetical protein
LSSQSEAKSQTTIGLNQEGIGSRSEAKFVAKPENILRDRAAREFAARFFAKQYHHFRYRFESDKPIACAPGIEGENIQQIGKRGRKGEDFSLLYANVRQSVRARFYLKRRDALFGHIAKEFEFLFLSSPRSDGGQSAVADELIEFLSYGIGLDFDAADLADERFLPLDQLANAIIESSFRRPVFLHRASFSFWLTAVASGAISVPKKKRREKGRICSPPMKAS